MRLALRKIKKNYFLLYYFFCVILLGSCTSITTKTQPQPSTPPIFYTEKQRNTWLNSLQTWEASGRFAIKKGDEGSSGSFEWNQYSHNDYKIHFYGPFGAGNAYLIANANEVTWKDSEGITTAKTPDALMMLKTHFIFPVSSLYDWILGRPSSVSHIDAIQRDKQKRLIYLNQSDWQIVYLAYISVGQGELPTKIEMTSGDLKIKLLISEWNIK